ncbi:hypothetical protein CYD30_11415 [Kosakonia cowanii]|nr:hypothetical protein CYD30_11415 [Kosakonia cowanii]
MAEKYYSILTNRGKELEVQSSATGNAVIIKDFVVGDGNGAAVTPDPSRTSLVREVYRGAISGLEVSPEQPDQFIAHLILPETAGRFVVREVGLLTDAGELYATANCASIEKPECGVSVSLQFRLAVSDTADIELKVSTGDGRFLRTDKNLSEIAAQGETAQKSAREALEILDASTGRKGLVRLSSAADSKSELLAATPKAVKIAMDNASARLARDRNGADIPDPALFIKNLGLRSAATRDVGTGPGQIPDMSCFSALLTGTHWDKASQWQKLPSGLLLQWGVADSKTADSEHRVTVAFPMKFSRAPFGIFTSSFNGSFLKLVVHVPEPDSFLFSFDPLPPDAPYYGPAVFWLALGMS